MVEIPDIISARLLEVELRENGFLFAWFLKDGDGDYYASDGIEKYFHPKRGGYYERLTQGIDKKHNIVIIFNDVYDWSYELIVQNTDKRSLQVLNEILKRVSTDNGRL